MSSLSVFLWSVLDNKPVEIALEALSYQSLRMAGGEGGIMGVFCSALILQQKIMPLVPILVPILVPFSSPQGASKPGPPSPPP